jgi:threonine dehydrogenase-like Zn-dependent dehydrogenase
MLQETRRDFIRKTAAGAALLATAPARVLGANDRVRVGMIGVGSRGQELLKQILAVKNAELVAVADIYPRRLDEAEQHASGVRKLKDHRQLLDQQLDGVIVASPLHLHARHFLDVIAAGKDLYCEKTMTWSIAEADECLASAKKSDRVIQIGLQHESSGAFADAKKWIADGQLGKITQVDSWMSRNTPHGKGQWVRPVPSDCTAQNVNWAPFSMAAPIVRSTLINSSTGGCSGSSRVATSPRTWCTRLRGPYLL